MRSVTDQTDSLHRKCWEWGYDVDCPSRCNLWNVQQIGEVSLPPGITLSDLRRRDLGNPRAVEQGWDTIGSEYVVVSR